MRQIGLDPTIRPADVDESYLRGESPAEHVERLARAKAEAVHADLEEPDHVLVVGGDTVVVDGERVLVKPVDTEEARSILLSLAGREHAVLSGVAVCGPGGTVSAVARTRVRMRPFTPEVVAAYVETGEPMDKAGGYGIQGKGAALVAGIEGDYYAVVGFPVAAFLDLLERLGWRSAFGTLLPAQGD